jgi:predicted ATPase
VDPLQIESITFSNFKALVNTTLPLGRFTLIVGANGSGKSTALQGIDYIKTGAASANQVIRLKSVLCAFDASRLPQVSIKWKWHRNDASSFLRWPPAGNSSVLHSVGAGSKLTAEEAESINAFRSRMAVYSLNPLVIPNPVQVTPNAELPPSGEGLAAVLDRLRDDSPEGFGGLNDELGRWLPEFDEVLFDTPQTGHKTLKLRTRDGGHFIPSSELSHGTLLALAMLTLAYLPNPPSLVGLEEPDRGIHPRLLREVRDALYRLAYPEDFGESRPPVQVVATTQSPYFLDLFRDHPEEVVIAEKKGLAAEFHPLSSHGHIEEILADGSLGDIWYSGILGGVPSEP